jgi:signal transduction histidine kinase
MAFIGQRRLRRPSIVAFYVYFSSIGIACLLPPVVPFLSTFPNGRVWAWLMLAGLMPCVAVGSVRLIVHARRQMAEERARTALVIASILFAAGGNTLDLMSFAGIGSMRPGVWALVVSAGLLAVIALRARFFERISMLVLLNVVAVACTIVLGELVLVQWLGSHTALLALGSVLIALGAMIAGRFLLSAMSESHARVREQAARGRMSRQLGHDLRNPLTSIKGAAQFLDGERKSGRLPDEHAVFLDMIVKHADRITRLVEVYERLARLEPDLCEVDINELVDLALPSIPQADNLAVQTALGQELPKCLADRDLVLNAVENLLRNAREALEHGGHISVTTRQRGDVITLQITDDGPGMDARTRENVFDDFFTTKPNGSGLGLPFVHRVMTVHRGRVAIDSTEGCGTTVTLELPIAVS